MISREILEEALNVIARGYSQYEYFFDKLDSSEWIAPLTTEGFLKVPPCPEQMGESGFWVRWPESNYLQRVAEQSPEEVSSIFERMSETDNPFVHSDLLKAALKMPGKYAAKLAEKERVWVESNETLRTTTPHDHAALVIHLIKNGKSHAALRLARALLEVIPNPNTISAQDEDGDSEEDKEIWNYGHAQTKLDNWYQDILNELLPHLVDGVSENALKMLCDLLEKAIRYSRINPNQSKPVDYSTMWFSSFDGEDRYQTRQVEHILALAVKDMCIDIVEKEKASLDWCVEMLESREWDVLQRTALYLLKKLSPSGAGLVRKRLLDRTLFGNSELVYEYFGLVELVFSEFKDDEKKMFVSWIKEGPDWDKSDEDADQEHEDQLNNIWICNRLHVIRESLDNEDLELYQSLVAELGDAGCRGIGADADDDDASWSNATSPISVAEIKKMTDDELLEYLKAWKPSTDRGSPRSEDLSLALVEAAGGEPVRFAKLAPRLIGEKPPYVRGVLWGLEKARREKKTFDWKPVLKLSRWVVEQDIGETDLEQSRSGREPGWRWTRKTIASLFCDGFGEGDGAFSLGQRTEVWEILEALCEDSEPTPEHEKEFGGDNMDPSTLSLNVTRGQAFHAAIRYAIWVRNEIKKDRDQSEETSIGFEVIPEVREILERHLDTQLDPSVAIRSVYGQYFPNLVGLDRNWSSKFAPLIFGGPVSRDELQTSAWETYVTFSRCYIDVLDILEDAYEVAVATIADSEKEEDHRFRPAHRLADHLMQFYTWGNLETERRRSILEKFFVKAWDSLRAHAIDYVGEYASRAEGEKEEEALARLRDLWAGRLLVAQSDSAEESYAEELSAFGSWFTSGRFDEDWAIGQLDDVLKNTGKINRDRDVARCLAKVADRNLAKALSCLDAMIRGDKDGMGIMGWYDEARKLLERCLNADDSVLKNSATNFVHWLGKAGHRGFRDLLNPPSSP
jgi:hypothetical protein